MKKVTLLLTALSLFSLATMAQIKKTTTATVSFDATTPKDDWPKATNNAVICALNTKNGKIEFKIAVANFSFKDNNAMIKEHWLDPKVMDGVKFPNATFAGKIVDLTAVDFSKNGTYTVSVTGKLTIHGVSKTVTTPGTITVKGGTVNATASFNVKNADYGISHPGEGAGKVAKVSIVTINATLK
jgi:polyisoprenoid-binding protein YceI